MPALCCAVGEESSSVILREGSYEALPEHSREDANELSISQPLGDNSREDSTAVAGTGAESLQKRERFATRYRHGHLKTQKRMATHSDLLLAEWTTKSASMRSMSSDFGVQHSMTKRLSEFAAKEHQIDYLGALPVLSTFSLLRFISIVHPAFIYSEYLDMLNMSRWRGHYWRGLVYPTVYFLVTRIACLIFAFQAFAVKLVACSLRLTNPNCRYIACLLSMIGLLNQCLGCIRFDKVLQDRLFLFIFGGGDAQYAHGEAAYCNVYRCRLAKAIWEQYWVKGQKLKAVINLVTFDHYDLQRLILDEESLCLEPTPAADYS
mmetsp:Transcript_35476/g.65646  ORF Transcript_35476/g.65646 Transcript_35476/m.65646 type:complete len:320 (+) Transcript_35476:46-1005(+)